MSSREAFEAWVDSNFPFKKDRFDLFRGEYKSQFTEQLWQSWQASREGLDAKLKSAENNDVDARCHVAELEAKCAALAAENATFKDINAWCKTDAFSNMYREFKTAEAVGCCNIDCMYDAMLVAIMHAPETPATDAFLAEVRAQGVEMFGRYHNFSEKLFIQKEAKKFAAKLRQEAAQ